jgi:hypothetical protein
MEVEYAMGRRVWQDADTWQLFSKLEAQHQRVIVEHENARRHLESLRRDQVVELRQAWQSYCAAINRLDDITSSLRDISQPRLTSIGTDSGTAGLHVSRCSGEAQAEVHAD